MCCYCSAPIPLLLVLILVGQSIPARQVQGRPHTQLTVLVPPSAPYAAGGRLTQPSPSSVHISALHDAYGHLCLSSCLRIHRKREREAEGQPVHASKSALIRPPKSGFAALLPRLLPPGFLAAEAPHLERAGTNAPHLGWESVMDRGSVMHCESAILRGKATPRERIKRPGVFIVSAHARASTSSRDTTR